MSQDYFAYRIYEHISTMSGIEIIKDTSARFTRNFKYIGKDIKGEG